jgi:hypothetical protein
VTYIFVRHRRDGKYEVRFNAEQTQAYRRMLSSLKTYFDPTSRAYDPRTRTWLVEDKSGNDVDRWRAKMVEELNPLMEFVCERQDAWEEAVKESTAPSMSCRLPRGTWCMALTWSSARSAALPTPAPINWSGLTSPTKG